MALQQLNFTTRPSRPTLTYLGTTTGSGGSTLSGSFTNNAAGLIIVGMIAQSNAGTARTISSNTIDGTAGTIDIQKNQNSGVGTGMTAAILSRRITTTTNFSVSITVSGNMEGWRLAAWRLTNNVSDTVITTGSNGGDSLSSISTTLNNLRLNNIAIAIAGAGGTSRRSMDWDAATGITTTENFDLFTGNYAGVSGVNYWMRTDANLSVSATFSGSTDQASALAAASWV